MQPNSSINKVTQVIVNEKNIGQRIDNFLFTHLKGVPKSRIYRALRKGEVRVNKKRVDADYRLEKDDLIRIPPLRVSERPKNRAPIWTLQRMEESLIYEDEQMLIINKPSGIAVHGGSGVDFGVIETWRELRPQLKMLELAHRIDRDTSGCLMIAKKRATLLALQDLQRAQGIEKVYLALVRGYWPGKKLVDLPLEKNILQSGERMVRVSDRGKESQSIFEPLQHYVGATLVKVTLLTGRTHQIRVHATHSGHPLAGDEKYGDKTFNKKIRDLGLKRMFLHAASLQFKLPTSESSIALCSTLDSDILELLRKLPKYKD